MKYLLDTHVFLWMIAHPENLSKKAKDLLEAEENLLFLSTVSGLEIAIKYQLGRLRLPDDPIRYIPEQMISNNIQELPIHMRHTLNIATFPEIHKDPFDRLLISQAMLESLILLTDDSLIKKYEVDTLW